MTDTNKSGLDIREQVARIDRELSHIHNLDTDSRWKPWAIAASVMTAAAALFGTAGAIVGYFLGRHL
jgi:hypothetical protein